VGTYGTVASAASADTPTTVAAATTPTHLGSFNGNSDLGGKDIT